VAVKADYYQVLAVSRTATQDEIKSAYRRAARENHPDRNQGDAEATERFKLAAEAYEVLSDPEKRSVYDRFGHDGLSGQSVGFESVEDIFRQFGGSIFDDLFGFGFGGGRRRTRQGDSFEVRVDLTYEEVAKGVTRQITLERLEPCDTCQGTGDRDGHQPVTCSSCNGQGEVAARQGFFVMRQTCPTCEGRGARPGNPCADCRGQGLRRRQREISVEVPPGVRTGERLRLRGLGDHGPRGAAPGDLYCVMHVRDHPVFDRHEEHLILDLPVTYPQMALGAKVEVPTLTGKTLLSIPRGSQHGDLVRVTGEGFPHLRRRGRGDLIVRLLVDVPTTICREEEKLLRELARLHETEISPPRRSFLDRIRDYFDHREGDEP
jgi:molecular chaperone DnaJ